MPVNKTDKSGAGRGLILALLAALPLQAQGGKTFLEWLHQYSPTGYFVINDYETRANKPGDHLKWIEGQTLPLGAVAVHETGHMRNLDLNSKQGYKSYYIGNLKDYKFIPNFTPFSSNEIIGDIPASLHNFQTEVYIEAGPGNYSVGSGIIGIMEEWNQYITGLKSGVEMSECFKANFNTAKAWGDLTNDVTTSVWSNAEFRYFCLRYIMRAKISHADIYTKMTTSPELRQNYTYLVQFAEATMAEWIAVLTAQKLNTVTQNGFDWHWKYWNEIQKQEYKDLEKIMLVSTVGIAPYFPARPAGDLRAAEATVGIFDLRGRMLPARGLGSGSYVIARKASGAGLISGRLGAP